MPGEVLHQNVMSAFHLLSFTIRNEFGFRCYDHLHG